MGSLILVLVAPQDIVNIGSAVRIAKNFGLDQVRLVQPEIFDPWRIEVIAHNTGDLVERITLHDTLADAVRDCVWTLALTARERTAKRTVFRPGAAAAQLVALPAEARTARKHAPEDVGLLFDATRCIGCRACVTKCKEANGHQADRVIMNGAPYDAPDDLSTTTRTVIKLWSEGDRTAFMKRQCMHCVDPACVSACMIKAYQKDPKTGVVSYDASRCLGDRYCQIACPFNVPKFEWSKAFPVMVKYELCRHRKEGPACSEVCPREAVISGKVTDHQAIAAPPHRGEPRQVQPPRLRRDDACTTRT